MTAAGKKLTDLLRIDFPVIMAPMFLVTNRAMLEAGMRSGIMATFPSLNFRKPGELEALLDHLNAYAASHTGGSYGINLIDRPVVLKVVMGRYR